MKTGVPLYQGLDDLYALHKASTDVDHGIKRDAGWDYFQPSCFVYAFFAFNSIYGHDWGRSFQENALHDWQAHDDEGNIKTPPENKQYLSLIRLCYHRLGTDATDFLADKLKHHLPIDVNPSQELKYIVADSATQEQKLHFSPAFSRICKGKGLLSDWESLLNFVYRVRCNIFHGTKHITELTGNEERHIRQRARLAVYAAILQAVDASFFHAAGRATGWQSDDGEV